MTNFLLWSVIFMALAFDFVNGFHDAANSIATVVATRVLTPIQAVAWAAFWNFIAFAVLGTEVAKTIAKGVVDQEIISIGVIFAALIGAIFWNVLTAWLGLPSSSSHALIGGMVGAGVAKAGGHVVLLDGLKKTGVFIIYSPMIGLGLGLLLIVIIMWIVHNFKHVTVTNKIFRRLQLVSAAAFSLGHGANDAQKTMGLILALLIATNKVGPDADVPMWVVLSAHFAIALGTMFGGWRIVKTMGTKLTRIQPMGGFAAETAAALTLFFTSAKGIPVSTTHTITGAIVGVGSVHRLSAVRWGVARRVLWAWIFTIPGAALVAAGAYAVVAFVS
ncbi:MAG: inorganic phosphate transporter [Ilumatobacteraceae bacterium]|nr:inorganic phosphate transporter [Ilumatobacteraceae bacterium]